MIPTIGIMIGLYIIVRMTSFITRRGERMESPIVKVLSVFTIIIVIFCMIGLVVAGK